MDSIVIHFEGLESQEVRVKAGTDVVVSQMNEWCRLSLPAGLFVAFKAKIEIWERVRDGHPL